MEQQGAMTEILLVTGLIFWACGAICDLTLGIENSAARAIPYIAGILGGVLVTISGVRCVVEPSRIIDLGTTLGMGEASLRLDGLAGLFLTLTGGLSVALSACLVSWSTPPKRISRRGMGAGFLLLLGAVTVVITAGDAFTFLFGWESLTIAFFALTSVQCRDRHGARTSWMTLGVGKLSGAALLFGFLLLAGRSGSLTFTSWTDIGPGALHSVAYALIVIGFGAKIGTLPFQVWIPNGYGSAPGPTRAAMAGLAVNVGFYGLWRFLGILGQPPVWLVASVLILGGISALVGIVFACVQSNLNRVIAYSSIENAGIILVGYGVALVGAASHKTSLIAIGLLAASLQVLAHALAKSSLFASAAFFEADYRTDTLEELRGIGHSHRTSGASFALGSLTLAGMPPTIGFVSEWFIFEALMQEFRIHNLALRLAMAVAGALVALTVGVAALTFIRLIGMVVLGRSIRSDINDPHVHDGAVIGRSALVVVASLCLGFAVLAPWVISFIARGLVPVVPDAVVKGALKSPWVIQPVYSNFSILSPTWLSIAMLVGFIGVAVVVLILSRGRVMRIRRVTPWLSATGGVSGQSSYSPFGYSNIVRHILSNILGTTRETLEVQNTEEISLDALSGKPWPAGVNGINLYGESGQEEARIQVVATHIEVRSSVVEPIETYLYQPIFHVFRWVVSGAKKLQSGRLDAYVGYMLLTLVVVLSIVAFMK